MACSHAHLWYILPRHGPWGFDVNDENMMGTMHLIPRSWIQGPRVADLDIERLAPSPPLTWVSLSLSSAPRWLPFFLPIPFLLLPAWLLCFLATFAFDLGCTTSIRTSDLTGEISTRIYILAVSFRYPSSTIKCLLRRRCQDVYSVSLNLL